MDTPTILINLRQLCKHRESIEKKCYALYGKSQKGKALSPRDHSYEKLEKLISNIGPESVFRDTTNVMTFGDLQLISYKTDHSSNHRAMKSLLDHLGVEFQEDY